jgi:sugar phosphate isomerase/epimerase
MNPISRRTLLKNGGLAVASMTFLTSCPSELLAESLSKAPGIQLYTVGKELKEDMPGTLISIAAIGYRSVESAGMGGKSPADFRKTLDAAGLKCPSSHLFLMPGQTAPEYFDGVRILGSEYVVSSFLMKPNAQIKSIDDYIKYIASLTQDDFKKMASDLNGLAVQAKAAGLKFAYHNHNMEFRTWSDGKTTYDMLMEGTDPSLVKIELDCGWADLAGQSPLSLLKKYSGRIRMVHIKDFVAVGHPVLTIGPSSSPDWTELGKGHIDYPAILAAAPKAGVEYIFVEQEPPYVKFTAMEAAKADFDYLQSIG